MFIHDFSPEIFSIGPLTLRWYGVLFVIGVIGAYFTMRHIFKERGLKLEDMDSIGVYLILGLVVGARLGHIVFYNWEYFSSNPIEILKIWNGGLASHGAAIGVFVAYLIWIKVHKVKFFKYADLFVIVFPLIAGFVRLGNFMNSEIVGVRADYGVVFNRLGEDFARHPVQLYSAFMNFLIFAIMIVLYKKYYKSVPNGFYLFIYMGMYFVGRFTVEFWKDLHTLPESFPLSMGQVLSIIPILISIIYFAFFFKKMKNRGNK